MATDKTHHSGPTGHRSPDGNHGLYGAGSCAIRGASTGAGNVCYPHNSASVAVPPSYLRLWLLTGLFVGAIHSGRKATRHASPSAILPSASSRVRPCAFIHARVSARPSGAVGCREYDKSGRDGLVSFGSCHLPGNRHAVRVGWHSTNSTPPPSERSSASVA